MYFEREALLFFYEFLAIKISQIHREIGAQCGDTLLGFHQNSGP
jgi:hypothetical protein